MVKSSRSSRSATAWSSIGKNPRSAPVIFAEIGVGDPGQTALGVLHDDHGVDAEDVARESKAAQHVVGDPAAGVSDDVGFAKMEPERGKNVDSGVHAGDDGEVAPGTWVRHVLPGRGVALVSAEEA